MKSERKRNRSNRKYTAEEREQIRKRLEQTTELKWKHFVLGYFCSENGDLYNEDTKRLVAPDIKQDGYIHYEIWWKGKKTKFYAHRIVGYCFNNSVTKEMLKDHKNYKAHHINFTKTDNRQSNICYLPTAFHIKLHSAVRRGLIAKEDINTLEKLMLNIDAIMAA